MITIIPVGIAILGAALVLMLALRVAELNAHKKTKRHRSKQEGLADILQYSAVVDDGVIVNKNGSLMAAWSYTGDDNASSTEAQRELISYRINQALARLGAGWMGHIDCIKVEAPGYPHASQSHFPDRVTAAMDEERRRLFQSIGALYQGQFVITMTFFPQPEKQRKLLSMMIDDDSPKLSAKEQTRSIIDQFKREIESIEGDLVAAFKLTRLKGEKHLTEDDQTITYDRFLEHLQFCATGIKQPVRLPNTPAYLDLLIGGQDFQPGLIPKVGQNFIQVIAIEGFPAESTPGMLSIITELNLTCRWSTRYIFLDQHEAISLLDNYRRKWKQKVRGLIAQLFNTNSGTVDEDAVAMVVDAQAAKAETTGGRVSQGFYTSVVVLMSENRAELERGAEQVRRLINNQGFTARVETFNTTDAFVGSFPGHGVENVRRPLIHTMNLADLLPTSTIWTGRAHAPCPFYPAESPALMRCVTTGHAPFDLNLHVSDVGHTVILGPTGSGKSTLLGIFAAQFRRYPESQIFAFDKGKSLMPITKAMGGQHFTVAGDSDRLAFAPLSTLNTKGDRAWAMDWIDTTLALNGVKSTPEMRNEIGHAIFSMHENGNSSLTDFCNLVQNNEIRDALEQYTIKGSMGYLLDAIEDNLTLSNACTFEIEELMGLSEKYALPVLLYLFRRIERKLTGMPAMLILDEAWLMLGHEAFRHKIREWLKVFRKANCMVVLATQSLSDLANSGILDVIIESTATKIFLPNANAREEEASKLYTRFGLNLRQIEILSFAQKKKDYYLVSEEGRRLFNLALQPLQLAFVGASDKESIATIEQLERDYGDGWVEHWLQKKKLSLHQYSPLPEHEYEEVA